MLRLDNSIHVLFKKTGRKSCTYDALILRETLHVKNIYFVMYIYKFIQFIKISLHVEKKLQYIYGTLLFDIGLSKKKICFFFYIFIHMI
jgi:hypothetical protein